MDSTFQFHANTVNTFAFQHRQRRAQCTDYSPVVILSRSDLRQLHVPPPE